MPKPFIKPQNKQIYTFYQSSSKNRRGLDTPKVELVEKSKDGKTDNEYDDEEYYDEDGEYYNDEEYYDEDEEYYEDQEQYIDEDDQEQNDNFNNVTDKDIEEKRLKQKEEDELALLGFKKDGFDYSRFLKPISGGMFIPAIYDMNELKKHKGGILNFVTTSQPAPVGFGLEEISQHYVKNEKELEKLNVDTDLIQALGDDGDFEDIDEDFILQANGGTLDGLNDEINQTRDRLRRFNMDEDDEYYPEDGYDEDGRPIDLEKQNRVVDEIMDFQFQKALEQYEEEEIGELDYEETQGQFSTEKFEDVFDEFLDNYNENHLPLMTQLENLKKSNAIIPLTEEEKKQIIARDWSKDILVQVEEPQQENELDKWDCETIISTYSTIYNHPSLIKEERPQAKRIIKLGKHGIPVKPSKQVEEEEEDEDEDEEPRENLGAAISKNESKEEKKLRKQQVKQDRKKSREQKKSLKVAFKQEELKQTNIMKSQQTTSTVAVRY
ncbi:hypothetical protein DLAC_01747 [Tieghemostelium lacteum]|uniref:Uncharacterized protein n=1 Tax=Tieghemostelium lacteum TaxID=361077 RepID=A0A152A6P4_TIELA|nr:hypothetical protein DLAC_01747 [Tieghemostelium lacteum]|eukprot:KYR01737.1 hypothetical protein DLAC_01747 [Tieghemostelium lacteum]